MESSGTLERTPEASSGSLTWRQLDGDRGLGDILYIQSTATNGETLVASGIAGVTEFDSSSALWVSNDGRDWQLVTLPNIDSSLDPTIYEVAANAAGFAARGNVYEPWARVGRDVVFWSADGNTWEISPTVFDTSLGQLASAENAFVLADADGVIWTSTDGHGWSPAGSIADDRPIVALESTADGLFALTQARNDDVELVGPVAVWSSADGSTWTSVSDHLGGGDWPTVSSATVGEVVALLQNEQDYYSNENQVWHWRPDAMWRSASRAPKGVDSLFGTSAGFVGIGQCIWKGETEEYEGSDDIGVTWTSADGDTWSYAYGTEHGQVIQQVVEFRGELIGLGFDDQRYWADEATGAVFLAEMPTVGHFWRDTGRDVPDRTCARR